MIPATEASWQAVEVRFKLTMTNDFQNFVTYLGVSDTLIEQATKEEVAEVARVLALHVAHYRQRYGDVSIEESLELLRTEKVSDEMAKVLADGFGVLVEVLKALGTPAADRQPSRSICDSQNKEPRPRAWLCCSMFNGVMCQRFMVV